MKSLKKIIPQFSELFFIGLFIYIFIFRTYGILNSDTDMFWHIRQGEWLIDNHKIVIDREIFSYMFDANNWKYLSWLSDIMYAAMYRLWGIGSIIVLTQIVITLTVYMIFRYLCKKGVKIWISLPLIFIFINFYSFHWLPRAAIFSYFFTAFWFIVIDKYYTDGNKKLLYTLPLIQIIWTNMQSSFLYGYIIFFFFGLSAIIEIIFFDKKEKIKTFINLFIFGSITLLVSGINPFGFGYFELINSDALAFFSERTSEYMSVDMHNIFMVNIYFIVMLVLLIFYGKKEKPAYILLLVFWQYSGFEYVRHMALFGIMAMLIVPQLIKDEFNIKNRFISKIYNFIAKLEESEKKRKGYYIPLIMVIIFIFIGIDKTISKNTGFKYKVENGKFPVKAIEYIKKNPIKGNCYNDYFAGGYMIWEFYPKRVVSMDPRATVYPMNLVLENYQIDGFAYNAFELLEKKKINWLFISKESFIAKAVNYRKDIVDEKYRDNFYVIYELKKGKKWTDKKDKAKGEKDGEKRN